MFTACSGTNAGDRLARRLGHFPLKVTQITSSSSFFLLPVFFLLLPPSPPIALSFQPSLFWQCTLAWQGPSGSPVFLGTEVKGGDLLTAPIFPFSLGCSCG